MSKRDFKGKWTSVREKGKKALRLYDDNIPDFISNLEKEVKKGNRTNMGFRYGENVEVRGKFIKQYAVDFNGTKELVKKMNTKR